MGWALRTLVRPSDDVTLVFVAAPPQAQPPPGGGAGAGAGAGASVNGDEWSRHHIDLQVRACEAAVRASLAGGRGDVAVLELQSQPAASAVGGRRAAAVAAAIASAADASPRAPFDLLVCGSRGMALQRRAAEAMAGRGSVASRLLATCPCPVLVVTRAALGASLAREMRGGSGHGSAGSGSDADEDAKGRAARALAGGSGGSLASGVGAARGNAAQ